MKKSEIFSLSIVAGCTLSLSVALGVSDIWLYGRPGNVHRVIELVTLFFGLSILGISQFGFCRKSGFESWSLGLRSAAVCICILGVIVSSNAEFSLQSFQDLGRFFGIAAFAFLLKGHMEKIDGRALENLCALLLIPGVWYTYKLVVWYVEMVGYAGFHLTYSSLPNFSNFRVFNSLQALLLPIYVYFGLCYSYQRLLRKVAYVVALIWSLALIYTGARSVMVAFIAASIFVVFRYPDLVKPIVFRFVRFAVSVLLVYAVLFVVVPLFLQGEAGLHALRMDSPVRLKLWLFSLTKIPECLSGCGGQSFVVFTSRYFLYPFGSPHNTVLALLIEYGWLPTLFVGYCFLRVSKVIVRSVRSTFDVAVFFSLFSSVVDSLFAGAIYTPLVGIVLPLLLSVMMSRVHAASNTLQISGGTKGLIVEKYAGTVMLTFFYALFFLACFVSWLDIKNYSAVLSEPILAYPRFWEIGNFFM